MANFEIARLDVVDCLPFGRAPDPEVTYRSTTYEHIEEQEDGPDLLYVSVYKYIGDDCRDVTGGNSTANWATNKKNTHYKSIRKWAEDHPDQFMECSDHDPEAVRRRQEEEARQQAQQQAEAQAREAELNRLQGTIAELRQQVRDRDDRINELNRDVGRHQTTIDTERAKAAEARTDAANARADAFQQRWRAAHFERQLRAQLQAQPTGHGGYQPDEDDEDEDDDIHNFGVHDDDDSGDDDDGGADGVSADGGGGGGGDIAAQQQQQQQQRGRHGQGGAKAIDDAVEVGVQVDAGEFVTLEKAISLMNELMSLSIDQIRREIGGQLQGKVDNANFLTLFGKLKERINSIEKSTRSIKVVQKLEEVEAANKYRKAAGAAHEGEGSSESDGEESSEDDDGGEDDGSH